LVYDPAYQDFGVITKIWTEDELTKLGKEPPYYTIEVRFPDSKVMPVDRYKPNTIDKFKRTLKDMYDES
jgi:hypothetical protein